MISQNEEDYNDFKNVTNKKINLINTKLNRLEEKINRLIDNYEAQNIVYKRIDSIENLLQNLHGSNKEILQKINNHSSSNTISNTPKKTFKEIRIEQFNIDKNIILDCLKHGNLSGDIKLFQHLYLNNISKEYYPIRFLGKKNFQYMNDGKWNDDPNGNYIKSIILKKNIARCYSKVNTDINMENNDEFIKNQKHISELSDEKYQDRWISNIKNLIKI